MIYHFHQNWVKKFKFSERFGRRKIKLEINYYGYFVSFKMGFHIFDGLSIDRHTFLVMFKKSIFPFIEILNFQRICPKTLTIYGIFKTTVLFYNLKRAQSYAIKHSSSLLTN